MCDFIQKIKQAKKKTPVIAYISYIKNKDAVKKYQEIWTGEFHDIKSKIDENHKMIQSYEIYCDRRNSALELLDIKYLDVRVEPGAIIRECVQLKDHCIVMMGAIINVGAIIGEESMIDMGAVVGARAKIGKRCHIGANAVIAGVIEPPSVQSVVIEDEVMIGANAVILEGIHIGKGAVVAAGSTVCHDVPENCVVAGSPATIKKIKDEKTCQKVEVVDDLRK